MTGEVAGDLREESVATSVRQIGGAAECIRTRCAAHHDESHRDNHGGRTACPRLGNHVGLDVAEHLLHNGSLLSTYPEWVGRK